MEETQSIQIKKSTLMIIGVVAILIVVLFLRNGSPTGNVVGASSIQISLSEISEQATFYNYEGIRYFVVKANDGSIKTAFDACDVCYSSNKGYRQEGNQMVCNNCGNKYPISGLGTENKAGGGCWPGYLPSKVEGDNLVIRASDIEKGRYRFK